MLINFKKRNFSIFRDGSENSVSGIDHLKFYIEFRKKISVVGAAPPSMSPKTFSISQKTKIGRIAE